MNLEMDGSRPLLYLTLFYTLFRAFRAVTARRSEVPLFQPFLKGLSTFVSPPKGFSFARLRPLCRSVVVFVPPSSFSPAPALSASPSVH